MSRPFDFGRLVDLCRRAHEDTRRSAARAVDTYLVTRNWLFGWYLVEYEQRGADRAQYGDRLLAKVSCRLQEAGVKGCSATRLKLYRQFYQQHTGIKGIGPTLSDQFASPSVPRVLPRLPGDSTDAVESVGKLPAGIRQTPSVTSASPPSDGEAAAIGRPAPDRLPSPAPEENRTAPIGPTPSDQFASPLAALSRPLPEVIALLDGRFSLGWSHYVTLLTIDRAEERAFYEIEAARNQWSVRELKRQIASSLYERLALSRDHDEVRRLSREGQVVEKASDLVKDPLVLEFLGLEDRPAYSETELETAIIDRLQQFLLELGKGFLFEARQKRFTFDNSHFFVDLVFYNRLLRCYVLIDLKRGELTHQDLGQMQMYVNYFDRHVKTDAELPTVGIVLCGSKNDAVVELTLPRDASIYASQYQLYLPSKQELKAQLESVQKELGEPRDRQRSQRVDAPCAILCQPAIHHRAGEAQHPHDLGGRFSVLFNALDRPNPNSFKCFVIKGAAITFLHTRNYIIVIHHCHDSFHFLNNRVGRSRRGRRLSLRFGRRTPQTGPVDQPVLAGSDGVQKRAAHDPAGNQSRRAPSRPDPGNPAVHPGREVTRVMTTATQRLLTGRARLPGFSGEWKKKRFGDICMFLSTANNPRADLEEHGTVGYVHYGNVHAHSQPVLNCANHDLPRIEESRVGNAARLRDGDLVMVDASEDLEGIGKSVEIMGIGSDYIQLVDQAVDFVLGKIDRRVGTRSESARAPRTYEIPPEVVTEAVVNAVAHRDYTGAGSVQVMLFADRLEVRNPGRLSPPLTLEDLRVAHNSAPGNPLLAEPLYLAEYIERMGTGTLDMIRRCAAAGLPEPEFAVTDGFVTTIRRATLPGQAGHAEGHAGTMQGHAEGQAGPCRGHAGPSGGPSRPRRGPSDTVSQRRRHAASLRPGGRSR